jgi:hypothetical protein
MINPKNILQTNPIASKEEPSGIFPRKSPRHPNKSQHKPQRLSRSSLATNQLPLSLVVVVVEANQTLRESPNTRIPFRSSLKMKSRLKRNSLPPRRRRTLTTMTS